MSLSTQTSVLAKRRAGNWITNFSKSFTALAFGQAFWPWMAQFGGGIDLQVVEFAALTNTDVVIANAACHLYAICLQKATATKTVFKGTDNATTCTTNGGQDFSVTLNAIGDAILFLPKGFACANGFTVQGNTTATGSTGSAANGPAGMVILGA